MDLLTDAEPEVVEVTVDLGGSELDKPAFLEKVVDYLCLARAMDYKYVSLDNLADHFKVTVQEFDDWGKSQRFLSRKHSDKVLYGLAKVEADDFDSLSFYQALTLVLTEDDKKWKSLAYLSGKLNKKEDELDAALLKNSNVLRKVGKNGSVLYGLSARIIRPPAEPQQVVKTVEKDCTGLMVLCMIHPLCDGFLRAMNFFGNKLAMRFPGAYSHLAKAQKELSTGVAILMNDLNVKDSQLPDIEKI